jgi:hypothetical protein
MATNPLEVDYIVPTADDRPTFDDATVITPRKMASQKQLPN